jgi:NDP-sugar pyrophosphorylase family protein
MNALILSAGLGERMRPITESIPKPLLPIVNQRLIDLNINHLLRSGVHRVGVNLHYKSESIREHLLQYGDRTHIIVEKELLGTGGALFNFQDFFKDDFILYSGDVVSDIKLQEVIKFHQTHNPAATLVLTKHQGIEFQTGKDNRIERIFWGEGLGLTFAGIAVFSRRVFSFLPQKMVFSLVDIFKNILQSKESIMGLPAVMRWYNINSPYAYWRIHHDLLRSITQFESMPLISPIHIAASSKVQTDALQGFVSINEGCIIAKDVYLENAIVLPRSRITKGNYRNCILSNNFRIIAA